MMRLPFVLFSIKAFVLMRAGLLCCFAWEDVRRLAGGQPGRQADV